MTVYVDIVFIDNLIMNLAIILSEAVVLNSVKQYFRKVIASTVGALFYILTLFYPRLTYLQIFISFIIIKISFDPSSFKLWIKQVFLFYAISFIFGGLSFAMVSLFNGGTINIFNGVLISDFNFFKLFLCGIIGIFLVIKVLKKRKGHIFKDIIIGFNNQEVKLRLLLDTGNLLRDLYTNKPVIIVEKDSLKGVLGGQIIENFQNIINGKEKLPIGMFIIPYKSIGNNNSFLLGFKPQYVIVKDESKKHLENVVIGICNERLSENKLYSGIFGLEILEEVIV